jgi:hypothetical protein
MSVEAEMLRCLRTIATKRAHNRRLRQQIKMNDQVIRLEQKHVKGLRSALAEERQPNIAPMRLMSNQAGIPYEPAKKTGTDDHLDKLVEKLFDDLDAKETNK